MPASTLKGVKNIEILAGVEKPHKTCTIYYRGGQATYRYGQKAWERSDKAGGRAVPGTWVNLADSMGYVVLNLTVDPSSIVLPKPGVRDFLSLHHVEKPVHEQCFVTVAFPNQSHDRTEARAAEVTAHVTRRYRVLSCFVPPYFICANFSDWEAHDVKASSGTLSAGPVAVPPHSIGILRFGRGSKMPTPVE